MREQCSRVATPAPILSVVLRPILAVVAIVYAIMTYYNHYMAIPLALVVLAFLWLQFFMGKAYYEYTLDGEGLRVELVHRVFKRRLMRQYPLEAIEMLAKSQAEELMPYFAGGKQPPMKDFASRKKLGAEYVLVARGKAGKPEMLVLELEDGMLEAFGRLLPGKTCLPQAASGPLPAQ